MIRSNISKVTTSSAQHTEHLFGVGMQGQAGLALQAVSTAASRLTQLVGCPSPTCHAEFPHEVLVGGPGCASHCAQHGMAVAPHLWAGLRTLTPQRS